MRVSGPRAPGGTMFRFGTREEEAVHRDAYDLWKLFPLQKEALSYSKTHGNLPLFALDKKGAKNPGAKEYVVASYGAFWKRYEATTPQRRYGYEILLENRPTHLHVDAEFLKKRNPLANGRELDEAFRVYCVEYMKELKIIRHADEVDILVFDSSNERKFSKHYIFFVRGQMFQNNYHCGAFMRRLRNWIMDREGMRPEEDRFFLWGEKKDARDDADPVKNLEFLCDLAIYTRNRVFRLLGSTKAKESLYRPMVPEHVEHAAQWCITQKEFLASLLQRNRQPDKTQLVVCLEEDGSEPASTSKKTSFRPDLLHQQKQPRAQTSKHTPDTKRALSSELPSIAEPLAQFIQENWDDPGTHVAVTPKYYHAPSKCLRMESNSTRCRVKEKATHGQETHHSGNHIFFMVDLSKKTYYQACYSAKSTCTEQGRSDSLADEPLAKRRKTTQSKTTEDYFFSEELNARIASFLLEREQRTHTREEVAHAFIQSMQFHFHIPVEEKV